MIFQIQVNLFGARLDYIFLSVIWNIITIHRFIIIIPILDHELTSKFTGSSWFHVTTKLSNRYYPWKYVHALLSGSLNASLFYQENWTAGVQCINNMNNKFKGKWLLIIPNNSLPSGNNNPLSGTVQLWVYPTATSRLSSYVLKFIAFQKKKFLWEQIEVCSSHVFGKIVWCSV